VIRTDTTRAEQTANYPTELKGREGRGGWGEGRRAVDRKS